MPFKLMLMTVQISAVILLFCTLNGRAQDKLEPPPLPVDNTPLIELISDSEKAMLSKESNPKKLLDIYVRISDTHILAALNAINEGDFKTSERELDIYNKSLSEAEKAVGKAQEDRRKISKKLEQTIYKQLRTLDTIERRFPAERAGFIEFAVKHAKQIRGRALNLSFDSGEVITDIEKGPSSGKPPLEESLESSQGFARYKPATARQFLPSKEEVLWKSVKLSFVRKNLIINVKQSGDDYLTEEEDDYVRQAQEPDLRIKVFMKIIDRRLKMLTGEVVAADNKKAQKDKEDEDRKWGALPKLDRAGYLKHYIRAMDEAMAKLDDAYERNPKAKAFTKALNNLLESTQEHLKILHGLEGSTTNEQEKSLLADAIEKATIAHKGAEDGLKAK